MLKAMKRVWVKISCFNKINLKHTLNLATSAALQLVQILEHNLILGGTSFPIISTKTESKRKAKVGLESIGVFDISLKLTFWEP